MPPTALKQTFQNKKDQAARFINIWKDLRKEIVEAFMMKDRVPILTAVEALDNANDDAHKELLKKLNHPTVSIATTGTTSSGKSTVVNLLCGHEIMPVATQEMSAGAVIITHDPEKRVVRVPETPGAHWECGEWDNQSDREIRDRLTDIMKKFREQSSKDDPSSLQIELVFPVRMGMDSNDSGIPAHFDLQIIDLPGLKFIGDKGNEDVIKECRNSLCLVTYNSEDTDDRKQAELLSQVVTQVKSLGGSPARMLFLLNRIDAFRKDEDWKANEEKFVNDLSSAIKAKLSEALPEYQKDIEDITVIKLSSMPAFLSLLLKEPNEDERRNAAIRLRRHYNSLFEEISWEISGHPRNWSEQDMLRISNEVWESSYSDSFQNHLTRHITEHLPELVIPQMVDEFRNKLKTEKADWQDCVEWSTQTITAEMNSSDEKYKATLLNLGEISKNLDNKRKENAEELLRPFNKISELLTSASSQNNLTVGDYTNQNLSPIIRQILKEIRYGGIDETDLAPLYQWMDLFTQTAGGLFAEIAGSIDIGETLREGQFISYLPKKERQELYDLSLKLQALEYHKNQKKTIERQFDEKKRFLQKLNEALNELANCLTVCMKNVMRRTVLLERERIYNVIRKVSQNHVQRSWIEAQKIIKDIIPDSDLGFMVPPIDLIKVDKDFAFEYKFEAGFNVFKSSRHEKVDTKTIVETIRKKVKTERAWYLLWIGTRDIHKDIEITTTEPIFETRKYDVAYIPGMEEIVAQWAKQFYAKENEMTERFIDWLTAQINELNKSIEEAQKEIVRKYKKKIEAARENAEKGHDVQMNRLRRIFEKAKDLESSLIELTNLN